MLTTEKNLVQSNDERPKGSVQWVQQRHVSMPSVCEHQETTWVIEPTAGPDGTGTAELYTTSRRLWLRAITRNPNVLRAAPLNPGYVAVWPLEHVKGAESLVRPAPGGDEFVQGWLTPAEVQARAAAQERMNKIRAAKQSAATPVV